MSRTVIVTLVHRLHKPMDLIKMTLRNVGRKMGVTSLRFYSEVGFDVNGMQPSVSHASRRKKESHFFLCSQPSAGSD
jgi:hypothetical protein